MAARKTTTTAAPVTHASLNEALFAVQQQIPAFQRDTVNPHFGKKYLALETLLPQVVEVLNANGLLLTQTPTSIMAPGKIEPALRTRFTHVATGESVEDVMPLTSGKETPQAQGSAITYAKRYSLMAALSITADNDDDANAAQPAFRGVQQPAQTVPQIIGDNVAELASPFPTSL
jgi:hypothetical protein